MRHFFQNSSAISGFNYDPENKRLDVTFKSGKTYSLEDVPASVVDDFQHAESAGTFFNSTLKGQYGG
jgi:lysyl-tRNA synthetase class 2